MQFIDTHTHLQMADFENDREEVMERAREAGVTEMIVAATGLADAPDVLALAGSFQNIHAAVGIHPHETAGPAIKDVPAIRSLAEHPSVVAIGEIGLDYFYDFSEPANQMPVLQRQLEIACEIGLPVITHMREAEDDLIKSIEPFKDDLAGGVLHCYTGTRETAELFLGWGFHISFGGIVTFRKGEDIREVASAIPVERMLLETDCPYLAPAPMRGKRCEPAYVVHVAEKLAELKGLSLEDIARITTFNARKLFSINTLEPGGKQGAIAYPIRDSLYLNITNRCTNECTFCVRNARYDVKGHDLLLSREPTIDEVMAALPVDMTDYCEVVFCGLGEPTMRFDDLKEIARRLKAMGMRTRLNTNGHGDIINERPIAQEMVGLIDEVCVSINTASAVEYNSLCRPQFGESTYERTLGFIRSAQKHIGDVTLTAVASPGIDIEACRTLAQSLGVKFRRREYNELG
ncbi:TatD family hydrolase [Candidatus Hydrogenedentota bacterium]